MIEDLTLDFRRRHLPHWVVAEKAYFVTTCLKEALPRAVYEKWTRDQDLSTPSHLENRIKKEYFEKWLDATETVLHTTRAGPRFLEIPAVAEILMNAFLWLEEKKYWKILAAVVMPNHIHLLMESRQGSEERLNHDIGLLKGYTGREANKLLLQTGQPFWANENFDHWCRSEEGVRGLVRYIVMNPVKAGLTNTWQVWPWTKVGRAFLPALV